MKFKKLPKEQVTIRLPIELYEFVQTKTKHNGISINAYILLLINNALKDYRHYQLLFRH